MYKNIVIIPALNPPCEILKKYIASLTEHGCERILIVDDGSSQIIRRCFHFLKRIKK